MKFRKRSIDVDAIKVTKDNSIELANFLGRNFIGRTPNAISVRNDLHGSFLTVRVGEWLIKGEGEGDFYPCDPEVFDKTYEPLEEEEEGKKPE